MSERALGCHCDLEPGQQPTGCVLDGHEPVENCSVAMRLRAEGKSQAQCEHWRPVQPSEVEQLRAEVERLRAAATNHDAEPAARATVAPGTGHTQSDTTWEPVLWALDFGGEPLHPDLVFASAEEAENNKRHTISYCQIVPLYRDPPPPTLNDAEREAVATASRIAGAVGESDVKAALRALLARLGGDK